MHKRWYHTAAWAGLYLFWVLVFRNHSFALARTVTVEFCYLIFIAANYYFHALFLLPRYLHTRKYARYILLSVAGITITAMLRVPLATWLNRHVFIPTQPQPELTTLFLNSLLNIALWSVALVAFKVVADRLRLQRHLDAVTRQKERAGLDFLTAQFNPHFLFNSINSIYGSIDKTNTAARSMLLTFSDMLRYQLYECNKGAIAIERELNYIKNYVALQAARREHLTIGLHIAPAVGGFSIEPLLFVAFIENAFKYVGNNEDSENSVQIKFDVQDNWLHFYCINSLAPAPQSSIEHNGIGIANTQRRLTLLYNGRHELSIIPGTDCFSVKLKLQFR